MKPYLPLSVLLAAVSLTSCSKPQQVVIAPLPGDDQAIVALVLEDFAHWNDATFGDFDGVLELTPDTTVEKNVAEWWQDKRSAPKIAGQLEDDLLASFTERNKVAVPVGALIGSSPWARIGQSSPEFDLFPALPEGVKAFGSMTLPGFNKSATKAFILIHHSWSIHGAVVAYVLSKREGQWRIVGRDQQVFL